MVTASTSATQYAAPLTIDREAALLEHAGWLRVARCILWAIFTTASVKPAEIVGMGEQAFGAVTASSPIDLAFRVAVLAGGIFTTFIAVITGRIRLVTLCFVPFLGWAVLVAFGQQSSFSSCKQLGSYASWILFFISACALFDRPKDFAHLRVFALLSVIVSAIGGIMEFALGHAPMIGMTWQNVGFTRVHTGAGGIMLDAATPFIAATLFLVSSGKRRGMLITGILLALWGSGNILRGGMFGFTIAMVWLIVVAPRAVKRSILVGTIGAAILVGLFYGGKFVQKSVGDDDELNTSGRIENWPQLIGWIQEEPVWGHGPNADMELLAQSDSSDLIAAHNELLSTAVNFGLVGTALLWLPLILLLIITLWLTYRYHTAYPEPLLAASGVLIMLVTLSFTDNTLRTPGIMILALAPVAVGFNWCLHHAELPPARKI